MMKDVLIENLEGIKNQFVLKEEKNAVLQSYESVVVTIIDGKVTFKKNWNYNITTSKYVYKFLEKFIYLIDAEIQKNIKEALKSSNKKAKFEKLIDKGMILYDVDL